GVDRAVDLLHVLAHRRHHRMAREVEPELALEGAPEGVALDLLPEGLEGRPAAHGRDRVAARVLDRGEVAGEGGLRLRAHEGRYDDVVVRLSLERCGLERLVVEELHELPCWRLERNRAGPTSQPRRAPAA